MAEEQGYDLSRFRTTYFEECDELLATAEETIARLGEGSAGEDDLNQVFAASIRSRAGPGLFR